MGRVTVTIHIDYPEGSAAVVAPPTTAAETPLDEAPWPTGVPSSPSQGAAVCPVHHVPWKTVPAGISKKNGKPYDSFQTCPEMGCNERPR